MNPNTARTELQRIARKAMLDRGLLPDFPEEVMTEIQKMTIPENRKDKKGKDLRNLLWCSIDNAESRDLDQLSYAEIIDKEKYRILVAIADVDSIVRVFSHSDRHAGCNTTTVYTVAQIFSMLPEVLSTDMTSLGLNEDRESIVIEIIVNKDGEIVDSDIYEALVCNKAKLDYTTVGAWLEGKREVPEEVQRVKGLAENILLQDQITQKMKALRFEHGALDFHTIEARPVFEKDTLVEMRREHSNRAKQLIEDLMIASNGVTARFLDQKKYPSIRRVVRTPKRWERIVQLASENNFSLPEEADSKALSDFLKDVKQKQPDHYSDISTSVLKLLGAGEYVLETPEAVSQGHFGLAVKDYAHSTAPNRRYADLVTQRLLKSAMYDENLPYTLEQLEIIARNCTLREDDARKVERQVEKSANALLLENRIGEEFEATITGAAAKGTWVKLNDPHVEGKLTTGYHGLEVGHKVKVRLKEVDVEAGFIDFERVF